MFIGTTPVEVKSIIRNILKGYNGQDIFIGCSGNFTVDRMCSYLGYNVYSNDISLYSKLIADILLNTTTDVSIKDSQLRDVFNSWPEHKYKLFISVLFTIKIAQFSKKKNDYEQEMWDTYISKSHEYFQGTVEKFEKNEVFDFEIKGYSYDDFVDFIKNKKGKGVGIMFPPTYKGGYEKIFEFVENVFEYPKPHYELFNPAQAENLFLSFLKDDENIIYTDQEWDKIEEYLYGKVVLGGRKNDIYIYSSVKKNRKYFVKPTKEISAKSRKIIEKDFSFEEEVNIDFFQVKMDEINYYKSLFMGTKVDYSTGGDLGIMFSVNGKVFGFASFWQKMPDKEYTLLHSDFVVSSNQRKLSKLVLFLLKSEEIRDLLVDKFYYYYEGLKTSVFTDKPVSMKYRGVFKLYRKGQGRLLYKAEFNGKSLKENYELWLKKIKSNK